MKKQLSVINILLLVSSLIGIALVAYSTVLGPGIGGDATIYITAARNFISGKGLGLIEADGAFRLLPYFPPGFPLLLSLFGLTGIDMIVIARWLNILLFGGLVFLFGRILISSGCKPILAWLGSLLIAFSPVLVPVSSWAMSEPLALLTGFASLGLLIRFLADEKQDANRNIPVIG